VHTVDLLEQAIKLAEQLGFKVRQDWLCGSGGPCELRGQKWIFVDLALDTHEQLDHVGQAIRQLPNAHGLSMTPELRRAFGLRRSA